MNNILSQKSFSSNNFVGPNSHNLHRITADSSTLFEEVEQKTNGRKSKQSEANRSNQGYPADVACKYADCGSKDLEIRDGTPPHWKQVCCRGCGRHQSWISKDPSRRGKWRFLFETAGIESPICGGVDQW